jgi:hypothetical protein
VLFFDKVMVDSNDCKDRGLVGESDQRSERDIIDISKKDIIKSKYTNKDGEDILSPVLLNNVIMTMTTDTDIPKSVKSYPINFINNKENKIYVSLNANNKTEAMVRDCEMSEIYDHIKFMLEDDMRFFGAMILALINRYATDYISRVKDFHNPEQIQETFDVFSDFCYNLGFYKDGLIPLQLKKINPNLVLAKQGETTQGR